MVTDGSALSLLVLSLILLCLLGDEGALCLVCLLGSNGSGSGDLGKIGITLLLLADSLWTTVNKSTNRVSNEL
jgi:hypothetical protein